MSVTCQERILVVEDEVDIAFVLKVRLEAAGYEVHTEGYGATALSYATEHQPDLVILDVKLPDVDGFEVCQQLRVLYPRSDVAVLMFTGLEATCDQLRGFANGADAYLTKRCEPVELLKTVEELLEGGSDAFSAERI